MKIFIGCMIIAIIFFLRFLWQVENEEERESIPVYQETVSN